MKILLFGKNGQVGHELQRSLSTLGTLVALDRAGHHGLTGDLAKVEGTAQTIKTIAPDIIVNAAAYTAVDKAESEKILAERINTRAPAVIAEAAKACGALFVHYSTDYVFDGSGNCPWEETDATGPLNTYGATKLAGEDVIRASGCRHLIFRSSWIYGTHGHNFIRTILHLARERGQLAIVADQFGVPTDAALIADITVRALIKAVQDPGIGELYHLAPQGETNWADYARYILTVARQQGATIQAGPENVRSIGTAEYPLPAIRPKNSRLDTRKLRKAFSATLPDWEVGVERAITTILREG